MSQKPHALLDLASTIYSNINAAEKELLRSAELGRIAVLPERIGVGVEDGDQSGGPAVPNDDHLIRAEVLRWLCTDKAAVALVNSRGVKVVGGSVVGELDLSYTTIPFPLKINRCVIPDGIRLEYSTVANLELDGCVTGVIWAVWLVAQKDVSLGGGFKSTGGVVLDSARIAGDLSCEGGTFINRNGATLSAFGSRIEGSVYLTDGFHSEGEINFTVSVIGGNFICSRAQFHNPSENGEDKAEHVRRAFVADQARIGGSLFLRRSLEIVGEAKLLAATITGDLDCKAARFSNPGGRALAADRTSIGGDVFFTKGFETDGILRMPGVSVGGNIDFGGSRFVGAEENGVNLETATIKRTVNWRNVETSDKTRLFLDDVTAGRYSDDEKSWPAAGRLSIFGFKYGRVAGVSTAARRRQWLGLQKKDKVNLQPYGQLAAALREAGHDAESKKVLIAKEDERYRLGGVNRLARVWGYVLKATIGYGYAPRRVLYWSSAVVLLGWLVFWGSYKCHLFSPSSDGAYRDPEYQKSRTLPAGYQTFSPLMYSLDVFLPIIDLHQESKWLPNPSQPCKIVGVERPCGRYLRYYLWVHIIIGWALTTLAVAGFSGIVRKD
jgi:hypothetical protein